MASRRTRLVMGAGIRPASRYFLHISKSSMLKLVVLRPNHIRNYAQQKKALAWSQSLSRDSSGISKLRAATPSAATARPSSTLQGQTVSPARHSNKRCSPAHLCALLLKPRNFLLKCTHLNGIFRAIFAGHFLKLTTQLLKLLRSIGLINLLA